MNSYTDNHFEPVTPNPPHCKRRRFAERWRAIVSASFGLFPIALFGNSFLEFESNRLLPDRAGQTIAIFLVNDGAAPVAIGGFDLALQIGDGTVTPGGKLLKPAITGLELVTGTLFEGFTPVLFADPGNQPFRQFWSIQIPSLSGFPEVPAHSQLALAMLTFDTTTLFTGEFQLGLVGSLAGDSIVYDSFGLPLLDNLVLDQNITIGESRAVPELDVGMLVAASITWSLLLAAARFVRLPHGQR